MKFDFVRKIIRLTKEISYADLIKKTGNRLKKGWRITAASFLKYIK